MDIKLSKFTKRNIIYFINNRIKLNNNNILLNYIINEFNNIKKFIKNNYIDIKINIINKTYYNYININNKLYELCIDKWVNKKVMYNKINKMKKIIIISFNNNNIFIKYDKKINKNILLYKIQIIIYFIEYIKYKYNITKDVLIYLLLTNLKKKIINNEIINPINVNSGYTDYNKNLIFIWRLEEFEKVIFHEIIHYFNLDKYDILNFELFNINGIHSYFEAYTDFLAIIYNIIFIGLITKISIKTILEIELAFIKNQALFINNYFKLGSWNSIPNNIIIQKTPAFSYYILKYILFNYALNNDFNKIQEYEDIFKIGIKDDKFINLYSARMILFNLKN